VTKTIEEGLRWLDDQLRLLGIDRAELARRGDFNPSTLTNAYSGKRGVGRKLANGIADGLGAPREIVYREFGILPEKEEAGDEDAQAFIKLLNEIPQASERERAIGLVTALLRHLAHQAQRSEAESHNSTARAKGKKKRDNHTAH